MTKKLNIFLAGPRGFCAGVDRAIEMVKGALKKYGAPVYVRHEIVHNKFVVENLKSQGAIFVEELNEIEDKSRPVIFSAHGVPKAVPEEALSLNLVYYDATCPLVSKIHKEVENFDKKNLPVILIGHRNHPEVIGTMGQTDKKIHLVEKVEEKKVISNEATVGIYNFKYGSDFCSAANQMIDLEKKINSELTTKINSSRINHDQLEIKINKESLLDVVIFLKKSG